MVKEFWRTIWAEVEVSNLGNVKVDIKKIQSMTEKLSDRVQKYDTPTFVKVKTKKGSAGSESRKRPVICLDTNQVFESITAACKYYGFTDSMLCLCLQGKKHNVFGYRWAYYTE